jgi:hypothetical protein
LTDLLTPIHFFFGKIQVCELAEQLDGGPVGCLRGVDLIVEIAQEVGSVITTYLGCPFIVSFVPVDTFEFRAFVPAGAEIPAVLSEGADTQTFLAVVQAVMVDIIKAKNPF